MRASLYNSRDIFAYLKGKEGKVAKKPVSRNDEDEEEEEWEF